jgi:hypothetical protein
MTRILILLASLIVTLAPADAADRRFAVTDFNRVVVEGPYVVRLVVGRSSTAVASGSAAALDRLTLDVSGQTLRIRRNRHYWGGNPGAQEGTLTIELATRSLLSARLIGPGSLDVQRLEGLRADLIVEGSGRLSAGEVAADNLTLGIVGSGRLQLSGTVKALVANIQGSGDLVAPALRAETATINSVTSGSVEVQVDRAATVTASGTGSVAITGEPACTILGPNADMVRCGRSLGTLEQR